MCQLRSIGNPCRNMQNTRGPCSPLGRRNLWHLPHRHIHLPQSLPPFPSCRLGLTSMQLVYELARVASWHSILPRHGEMLHCGRIESLPCPASLGRPCDRLTAAAVWHRFLPVHPTAILDLASEQEQSLRQKTSYICPCRRRRCIPSSRCHPFQRCSRFHPQLSWLCGRCLTVPPGQTQHTLAHGHLTLAA